LVFAPPAFHQAGRPGNKPKVDGREKAHEAQESDPDLAPIVPHCGNLALELSAGGPNLK
jgi:hypothetical protein